MSQIVLTVQTKHKQHEMITHIGLRAACNKITATHTTLKHIIFEKIEPA
ncbi:MAG: hypothetical protein WBQ25_25515 [Nitrososphaeraceae archaeon]